MFQGRRDPTLRAEEVGGLNSPLAWPVTLFSAALLWIAATVAAGGREPWDSELYWTIFFPGAVLLSAALGFAFAERAWRWPVAVMLMQLPVMTLMTDSGFGLLPLGIILLLFLSLPGIAAAVIASWARGRLSGGETA